MKIIKTQDYSPEQVITQTVQVLKSGGLVIFPSDTVYGLLVDATHQPAVQKLIDFKNRPPGKAISIFVGNFDRLFQVASVESSKQNLLYQLLPGPYTVILQSKKQVCAQLESEKCTIGVRIPQFQLVNQLVEQFGQPVTATSANLGGKSPHYSVTSLLNQLPQKKTQLIDLIIDAGTLPHNKPSTIVDLTTKQVAILRKGDIVTHDEQEYLSESPIQTRKIARHLLTKIYQKKPNRGQIIILSGDLGAGKTQFVKGLAEAVQITEKIISPTFVINYEYLTGENSYGLKLLNHYDLYNVEDSEELNNLSIHQNINQYTLTCIEWGEKSAALLPNLTKCSDVHQIQIDYINEDKRKISYKFIELNSFSL